MTHGHGAHGRRFTGAMTARQGKSCRLPPTRWKLMIHSSTAIHLLDCMRSCGSVPDTHRATTSPLPEESHTHDLRHSSLFFANVPRSKQSLPHVSRPMNVQCRRISFCNCTYASQRSTRPPLQRQIPLAAQCFKSRQGRHVRQLQAAPTAITNALTQLS
ncbi:hypothetical protein BCR44DRAFT_240880 [Catenaria anguillulae PL171]|uniref:Uncharacterized protein n=1 Tax=Catenaria anguillulae PL171 TaxID=765915 RepID=A0A1Y2HPN3_9FUNG|nr:hypothetical protein BCR44DRAFT_240880 [Catenaria anguillulae PL171]